MWTHVGPGLAVSVSALFLSFPIVYAFICVSHACVVTGVQPMGGGDGLGTAGIQSLSVGQGNNH